jgi:hypothetical protein
MQIEKSFDIKYVNLSFELVSTITLILEAWNAAAAFIAHQKDMAWKTILLRSLKAAKKFLMKIESIASSETSRSLHTRLFTSLSCDLSVMPFSHQ